MQLPAAVVSVGVFSWLILFHKTHPYRFAAFAGRMPEQGLLSDDLDDTRGWYLLLIPFEDERSARLEDAHTFLESLPNIILPRWEETTVFLRQP